MTNPAYWNKRKQQLQTSLAKDEKRLFAKLATYYERESARLEQQIAAYYAQYGESNVLAYRQLLQTLPEADIQLLLQDYDTFAQRHPEYAYLLPVRESIYKLNRLEGLQTSVLLQQLNIGAVEQSQLDAFFREQAARAANFAAEQLGFGESFYRIDSDIIQAAVGNNWCEGGNFSERIWSNRQKLARTLQTEIVSGIIRGEDYHTLAAHLREKFTNVSKKQAERLVYTEDTYLSCEAAMLPFEKDPSFTEYQFICTQDGNACTVCKALHGQTFSIRERTPGTNFPPMHPWCRCFFDIVIPDWETMQRNEEFKQKYGEYAFNALTEKEKYDILKNKESLSNLDARKWYLAHDKKIPDLIDKSGSIEEQARQAFELRNGFRTITRDMMEEQETRKELDKTDPNKTFEELLESKMRRKGLTREEAVADILRTATKTRSSVNKKLGLE